MSVKNWILYFHQKPDETEEEKEREKKCFLKRVPEMLREFAEQSERKKNKLFELYENNILESRLFVHCYCSFIEDIITSIESWVNT